jgi:crotonobetainyl-CoA:carnitine CoA-transferase CaiB-like acyl-CoA transferase
VNDIMGGMFGANGAMAALMQRGITGRGQEVDSALFENNVFLVGQHMMHDSPPARIGPGLRMWQRWGTSARCKLQLGWPGRQVETQGRPR